MKKKFCILILLALSSISVFAQQITKVAVLDTDRIYSTFRRESQAAKDYESKKESYQKEIKKLQDEILNLRKKKVDAQAAGKDEKIIKKYEALISSKTSFLTEYTATKNDELKRMRRKLLTADEFYSSIYEAVKRVAEREGFTVVFTLQESMGIIWYSATVDITDLVLDELK